MKRTFSLIFIVLFIITAMLFIRSVMAYGAGKDCADAFYMSKNSNIMSDFIQLKKY